VIIVSASSSLVTELTPTIPHLVWSATTTRLRPASIRALFVSASRMFGVVKPDPRVDTVSAHEDDVDVEGPYDLHRERTDEGIRWRSDAAAQDDRLIRPAFPVQGIGNGDRVRQNREPGYVQRARARERTWWSRPRSRLPVPGATSEAAAAAMAAFSLSIREDFAVKPGSKRELPSIAAAPP